ncbi:MAG TPA: DUF5916 domain-containing protein [Longimicrobium sp.]|jgi:hypothetical protein
MTRRTALALLLVPGFLSAQAAARPTPTVKAAAASGVLRIDGKLDEAAWGAAEAATGFTESYPNAGAPARFGTEARVLYADDAIYVGMRMLDPRPDSIAAQLTRRDATGYSDWAQVMIDSYADGRTGFAFGVNPRGVKRDVYLFNDASEDFGWDAVWEVATQVDSAGWTAEFRIPLSQLRFARGEPAGGREWGLQLVRDIARYDTRLIWSPWNRNDNGFVSRFGKLTGLRGVRAPRRLEVQPYTVARLTRAPDEDGNPFYRSSDADVSAGADVRWGLPSGLTLTAAINPDFGQVEVDPAVVNLSAFETQLPERRPFFAEGTDIFRFGSLLSHISLGGPQFFYTRRIGRAPQRQLGSNDSFVFYEAPQSTTILGAAKLSGKTASGWTVGVLDAVTAGESGRVLLEDGVTREEVVEPRSNYLVGRVRRDLNAGRTVLGGIATATHRGVGDSVFTPMLRSDAYVAGVDGEHSWGPSRMWSVSGFAAGSRVAGSAQAIASTQRSSARYYLRPDADYLSYDSTRTSLEGYAVGAALRKGGDWRGSIWMQQVSPGFETNDLGFQSRADSRGLAMLFGRRQGKPGPLFREWFVRAFTSHTWNLGGDRTAANYAVRGNGTFRNLWSGTATVEYGGRVLSDRLTRGGPLAGTPSSWAFSAGGGTDPRRRLSVYTDGYTSTDEQGGYFRFLSASIAARPAANVQVSVGPSWEGSRNATQYVRTRTDATATETFGRRYVFATLDQTTVGVSTRLDWTFTPTLSLQLYARPFISAAEYRGFKELAEPRGLDYTEYGRDAGTIALDTPCGTSAADAGTYTVDPDGSAGPASCFQVARPDFNFRNLRGNAVVRWEYRPGSTLFFVWQQERSGEEPFGDFALRRDASDLFGASARNVFLVKATYWLAR